MNGLHAAADAEVILSRLRRLVTLWRATYVIQMILLLLLTVAVGLEISLPGVLALLVRSEVGAQILIPVILVPLLVLDPVAGYVEHRMGRGLRVKRTPLRKVLTVAYMVPGVMLARRSLLLGLALMWLLIIIAILVLWFVGLMLLVVLMRVAEPLGEVFGKAVDAVDIFLSWLYFVGRQGLREIALSPVNKIEDEEHIVLPLLAAQFEK
jgi:hypothetical protein